MCEEDIPCCVWLVQVANQLLDVISIQGVNLTSTQDKLNLRQTYGLTNKTSATFYINECMFQGDFIKFDIKILQFEANKLLLLLNYSILRLL